MRAPREPVSPPPLRFLPVKLDRGTNQFCQGRGLSLVESPDLQVPQDLSRPFQQVVRIRQGRFPPEFDADMLGKLPDCEHQLRTGMLRATSLFREPETARVLPEPSAHRRGDTIKVRGRGRAGLPKAAARHARQAT
jgi:hypothetical protein